MNWCWFFSFFQLTTKTSLPNWLHYYCFDKKRKKRTKYCAKKKFIVHFPIIFHLKMTLCQMDAHKKITNHEKKILNSKNSSKLVTLNFGSLWYYSSSMTQLQKLPALMYFSKKTVASTLNLYYFLHELIHEWWLIL